MIAVQSSRSHRTISRPAREDARARGPAAKLPDAPINLLTLRDKLFKLRRQLQVLLRAHKIQSLIPIFFSFHGSVPRGPKPRLIIIKHPCQSVYRNIPILYLLNRSRYFRKDMELRERLLWSLQQLKIKWAPYKQRRVDVLFFRYELH